MTERASSARIALLLTLLLLGITTAAPASAQDLPTPSADLPRWRYQHRPRPVRAATWILAEQAFLISVDTVVKPPTWGKPTFRNFLDAFRLPPRKTDDDFWYMNYVLHPLMGAHFYMAARNNGLSVPSSMLYSVGGTLFWEFVVESWYERPVLLDILLTPLLGIPVGIMLQHAKQPLRSLESENLRGVAILPLDPIEGVDRLFFQGPPRPARW